jgi:hypothetical protein
MNIKPFKVTFLESESMVLTCFNNVEINQHNIAIFLDVYEKNSIQLKNDNEKLKREYELLKSQNDVLFNENYELKKHKVLLEAEVNKLEFINNYLKNNSTLSKNCVIESEIISGRDTKIGDEIKKGNQNIIVNNIISYSKGKNTISTYQNNNMALIETATAYILGIITENEEVKKFPTDFVSASMKWICSWFLEDDPKAAAKLSDVSKSDDYKKAVIEAKLEDLEGNEVFQKELAEKLQAYSQHKITRKNMVENADIEADGSVWIGDKEGGSENVFDEKNIVKGGSIKAGKDFRLGDG